MKSLVLLTYITLSPGTSPTLGPAEFFDDTTGCQVRMQQLREEVPELGSIRCSCLETAAEVGMNVDADGNELQ